MRKDALLSNHALPLFLGRFGIGVFVDGRSSLSHFGKFLIDLIPERRSINKAEYMALEGRLEGVRIIAVFETDHECDSAQERCCDLDTSLTLNEVIAECVEVECFGGVFLQLGLFVSICISIH